MKLGYAIFILCSIGLVLLLTNCSGESGSAENRPAPVVPAVEAIQVRHGALPLTERLTGVVKANNQVDIYPEVSAVIEDVYSVNGDLVRRGDPLVRLRDSEFRERLKQAQANYKIAVAQVRQAEARLQEIETELKRTETLAEKGLASPSELEAIQTRAISAEADLELARARVEQAQATVDEREETLSQTVVRAPVTGSVGNRNAEIGMLVNSNSRLFTLGKLDSVRVLIVLTDRMLNYIEQGQKADIFTENSPSAFRSAPLSRISPFLHPVTHSTEAEIDMENPDRELKPGMFVTVDVHYGESEQASLVPLSALYEHPGTGVTGVYVTEDSLKAEPVSRGSPDQPISLTGPVEFKFRQIEVVAKGRMVAGIRGVDPDQWVITLGQELLGGQAGNARVRPVTWGWVEELQQLQRQDLLNEVMDRQQATTEDTISSGTN